MCIKLVSLLIATCCLMGCMDNPEVNGDSHLDPMIQINSFDNLTLQSTEALGSGRILMDSQMRTTRTSLSFRCRGQFLEDDSVITFHLFFTNFNHDNGIRLELRRDTEHPDQIMVLWAEPGRTYQEVTHLVGSLSDNQEFSLRIELVHQLNQDQRLLVWNDSLLLTNQKRTPRDFLNPSNADFDSLTSQFVTTQWGRGLRWGVTLYKMRLSELKREVPIVAF